MTAEVPLDGSVPVLLKVGGMSPELSRQFKRTEFTLKDQKGESFEPMINPAYGGKLQEDSTGNGLTFYEIEVLTAAAVPQVTAFLDDNSISYTALNLTEIFRGRYEGAELYLNECNPPGLNI
ncbi:MAG: hypothetical protein AAF988_01640 [Pseudomonadota bacterium]